jgi:hypothetical protein
MFICVDVNFRCAWDNRSHLDVRCSSKGATVARFATTFLLCLLCKFARGQHPAAFVVIRMPKSEHPQSQASRPGAVARFKQDTSTELAGPAESATQAAIIEAIEPVPQAETSFYSWREQWYPVHYAADLVEGEPQRVWLFDEAIVVARRPGEACYPDCQIAITVPSACCKLCPAGL